MNGVFRAFPAKAMVCLGILFFPSSTRADLSPPIHRSTTEWRYNSTGIDPGPNWREPGFDDAAWSTGFGLFGADGGYDTPFLTPLPVATTSIYYFRTHFSWSGSSTGAVLTGRLYVDDGCVIWINGVEVFRENVGDNPVTHQTLAVASNPRGEPVQFNFEIDLSTNTSNPLIEGDNLIAVSLHHSNIGTDIVFGLDLQGGLASAPVIVDPNLPANAGVRQGFPHTLTVAASGIPAPTYQWFKDTFPIPGATRASHTIADMTSVDAGAYRCEVTNPYGTVVSRTATLSYFPDDSGPFPLSGWIDASGTNVTVTFNERMDPGYHDAFRILIYPTFGDPFGEDNLEIFNGVLDDETNWVFSTLQPALPGTLYSVLIQTGAVSDRHGLINELDYIIVLETESLLFDFDDHWFFHWQSNIDAQPWKEAAYNDSSWAVGPGLLGTEANLAEGNVTVPGHFIRTPFPASGTGADNLPTTYLRKKFIVPEGLGTVDTMTLDYLFDDGVVVFLNGTEIIRHGLPAGETFTTLATSHEANVVDSFEVPVNALVPGENILAVRVHDATATGSSDRVWGARLRTIARGKCLPAVIGPVANHYRTALGNGVTLSVTFHCPPVSIQWYKDGVAIPDTTRSTYDIPLITPSNAGDYHAVASFPLLPEGIVSGTITVSFTNESGPHLISGELREDGTVALRFDEGVDPSALNRDKISVYSFGGDPLMDNLGVESGRVENGVTWALTLSNAPTFGLSYSVRLLPDALTDLFGLGNLEMNHVLSQKLTVFPFDGSWAWTETNVDSQNWTALDYDDGLWPSGPGFFGTEPNLGPGNTTVPGHHIRSPFPSGSAGALGLTTYLRKKFILPALLADMESLTLSHLYDDGIVLFLNGTEIKRVGVATNETFNTPGASHEANIVDTLALPLNLLVEGENILAVRVHDQAAASSDRVWGAQLQAVVTKIIPLAPTITDPLPTSQSPFEGATITYSVTATGVPLPILQWYKDGLPIPGANSSSYIILSAGAGDNGVYTVTASNFLGTATSAGAWLQIGDPPIGPHLVSACVLVDLNRIMLQFSEGLLEESATNIANYSVALRGGGGDLTVHAASLSAGNTTVTLDVSGILPRQNYTVTVRDVTDDSGSRAVLRPNPTIADVWTEVIVLDTDASSTWFYHDGGIDLGTAWKNPGFDTAGWNSGAPLFLAKRGSQPLTDIPVLASLNLSNTTGTAQIPAAYFRTTLNFIPAATEPFLLRYIIDDGAVFYLNGTEIHRVGIHPAIDPVTFNTLANRTQGNDQRFEESVDVSAAAHAAGLVQGGNLLAVEAHQSSLTSSDLAMAVQVLTKIQSFPATPVLLRAYVMDDRLWIEISGDNAYLKSSPVLSSDPADYTTVSGPHSTGTIDAGPADGQRYFILGDSP